MGICVARRESVLVLLQAVRTVAQTSEERDALGLKPTTKKMDPTLLSKLFPDGSSGKHCSKWKVFNPQWYLLEHHSENAFCYSIEELREALKMMQVAKADEAKKSEKMHKANLYSLINCVDSLAVLHGELERSNKAGEFAVIKQIGNQISEARLKAESVFKDVLSRKDRADATRNALSVLTRFKFIFFLSKTIDDNMKKGEYLTILNDYMRAKSLYKDTEVALFKEVMAHLDTKMEKFKEEMKMKLIDTSASFEEQSKLIKYLKILEPESDPTWECITAYHCWLEEVLWKLQETHYKKAVEAESNFEDNRFTILETNERQVFVSSLVSVLMHKLQSFWKLSNTYTTNEERWTQRQDDINQMLVNTINVSSWLILNALVPKALPDDVIKRLDLLLKMKQIQHLSLIRSILLNVVFVRYEAQFVRWPEISAQTTRTVLTHSLKTLRSFISSLLEAQFTSTHVQPLVELCMTVRLKFVSDVIDSGVESICALGAKEDWKQDFSSSIAAKTALPDFYENEVFDCLSAVRDALSTSGYPNEACLFSRERFRSTLVDIFVHLLTAIRHCFDRLLNLRADLKKPQDLDLNRKDEEKSHLTTKKLLISICNLEFILETALKNISRRLLDCGVKYADEVYEKSKSKLSMYRKTLVRCYIMIKSSAFTSLIDSANYEFIPDDGYVSSYKTVVRIDVSDYAKEIMMCCVLQQAELELCAPQLTSQCLQAAFDNLLDHLEAREPASEREVTQRVIDICALEQLLGGPMSMRIALAWSVNLIRGELILLKVTDGEGYEVGNRKRFAAVLRMELFLLLCSFFVYHQLMLYFDKEEHEKYERRNVAKDRNRASTALIIFMVAAQMVYFLYFAPETFQGILFDFCALLSGVWTNLLGIVAGFFILNAVIYLLKVGYSFYENHSNQNRKPTLHWLTIVRPEISDQVSYSNSALCFMCYECDPSELGTSFRNVLIITLVMSLLMWLGSDKIVIKHVTIPVKNFTGSNGSFKIALVSDIHAGASVHREQVSKVVDKLLDLHVDAVALVGDLVDGPLRSLEDRMVPLWMLLYRYRTYFVSGNHEYYYGDAMEWFKEYDRRGIRVLNNKCDMFQGICVVGVNDISSGNSGIHGHTHAGQYYVLVPVVSWLLPYFHGLYDLGHGKLFVSAGTLYQIRDGKGYEVGNRRRFIATLRMECFMLLCNFFIYSQLMAYYERRSCDKSNNQEKSRTVASAALISFMIASQGMYFLYFASEEVQDRFFDVCAFFSGIWINLLGLVAGCFIVNSVVHILNAVSSANFIVRRMRGIPYLSSLLFDRRCQIRAILLLSVVMSFVMWVGSDDVLVKQITIPVKIAKVSSKLHDLDVDAVALVGDMVDGPVKILANRMEPLWSALKRHHTYFVSGNHEYYYGDAMMWFVEYEIHGVRVLNNRSAAACEMFRNICVIGVNDVTSKIAGVRSFSLKFYDILFVQRNPSHRYVDEIVGHHMNLTEAMRNCTDGTSRVLLAHNPSSLSKFSAKDLDKIDIVLSGHTHAGQYYVVAPAIWLLWPYLYGLYDIGHGKLFVSAGTLYGGAPMKMLWMSEIWIVELVKETV
ncbi:Ser/Thr phosphatase family protein [Ostertagia ostertagi]